MPALALTLFCLALQSGSDIHLTGAELDSFLKTKGAAHAGRDVHWHVPAKALSSPARTRAGWALFVHRGVGLLIRARHTALEEVRRRGGVACVRGRVQRTPGGHDDDPPFHIQVREIRRRKK